MEKFAALYCRVSTSDKQDYTRQVNELKLIAQRHGYHETQIQVFAESVSGYKKIKKGEKSERIQLETLLKKIVEKPAYFGCVYTSEISRIGRNPSETRKIIDDLTELGVPVYIQSIGQSTLDDNGKRNMITNIILQVLMEYANLEAETFKTRSRSGLLHSAKSGNAGGGKNFPYGFKKLGGVGLDKKMLVINESEAKIVRDIFNLSLKGNGIRVIATTLNERGIPTRIGRKWRDGTIYSILTNTISYGARNFKGSVVDAPAIISKELFDMVQSNLRNNAHFKPDTKHFYLLKGLIKCGNCGKSFYGKKRSDLKDKAYVCISGRYTKEFCGCRGIDIDYLDSVVINSIEALPEHIENFFQWYEDNNMVKSYARDMIKYREREKELQKKVDNLIEIAADGSLPKDKINSMMDKINVELENCKQKKWKLAPMLNILGKKDEIIEMVRGFKSDDKQILVRSLVERITIDWVPIKKYHLILIDYKIDQLTEYKLRNDLQVEYKQKGFRLDRSVSNTKLAIRQIGSQVYVNVE